MTEERWPERPGTEQRIARAVARVTDGDDAGKLYDQVLGRLAYRRRHSGKTCSSCREVKPLSAFGVNAREADGLNRVCKQCRNSYERDRVNADLL
ncbi:hypothetical protein SEA_SNEK_67 [Arthrobacter phage Snek]|uniref:Uncharacterized protein n=1 Tax=Arthrobacter phage Tweety19 TaxID=2768133 RepID=A0A7G9W264_9CAUD|nr:HNH endonuclease [Arthrobacter phage Tweety19]QNO12727.1 hypothetical protein SEA_TWEETY19_68 [Arthrobacter phage Tweety19]